MYQWAFFHRIAPPLGTSALKVSFVSFTFRRKRRTARLATSRSTVGGHVSPAPSAGWLVSAFLGEPAYDGRQGKLEFQAAGPFAIGGIFKFHVVMGSELGGECLGNDAPARARGGNARAFCVQSRSASQWLRENKECGFRVVRNGPPPSASSGRPGGARFRKI